MQKSSATCACLPNKDTLSVEIVKKKQFSIIEDDRWSHERQGPKS